MHKILSPVCLLLMSGGNGEGKKEMTEALGEQIT